MGYGISLSNRNVFCSVWTLLLHLLVTFTMYINNAFVPVEPYDVLLP